MALAGFFGMLISGTRGAIAVPALGGIMLLILKKNLKVLILGAILGIGVYIFFAHTTIGQGNAEIRRMRTAFDPNEPSLMVRLENQKKLKISTFANRPTCVPVNTLRGPARHARRPRAAPAAWPAGRARLPPAS